MDVDIRRCDSSNEEYTKPSLDKLQKYNSKIEELLEEYGTVLAPKIVEYEVENCEFPIEVLNEIRAIYAHLYRASVSKSDEDTCSNIDKAKSHSKRAVLDCYKYLCVTYDDRYHEFLKRYSYVDWSRSGLQSDIQAIDEQRAKAVHNLRRAKTLESTEKTSNGSSVDSYRQLYELSYNDYLTLMQKINELSAKMARNGGIVSKIPHFLICLSVVLGVACLFLLSMIW